MARAKSVFPTPAGPSTSTGFWSRSARKAAVAIAVDARYPVASRRPSASVTELKPPGTPEEEGEGVTEFSTVSCRPCFLPAARPMRISWISEVRRPGTNAGPARAKRGSDGARPRGSARCERDVAEAEDGVGSAGAAAAWWAPAPDGMVAGAGAGPGDRSSSRGNTHLWRADRRLA